MSANPIGDGFAAHFHLLTPGIPVQARAPPTREGGLPFEISQFQRALRANETRFHPIRPVTTITIPCFVHDEVKGTGSLEICLNVHRMPGRPRSDHRTRIERFWFLGAEGCAGQQGKDG